MELIARYRTLFPKAQLLETHLLESAEYALLFASKLGYNEIACIAGFLHDAGKGTEVWQNYLAESISGKIQKKRDHATAGALLLEKYLSGKSILVKTAIQAAVMYHHGSGLPDMISSDGSSEFLNRLNKKGIEADIAEIEVNLSDSIKAKIKKSLESECFKNDGRQELIESCKNACSSKKKLFFNMGMHLRNLSSCLIDADRTDSAVFERGETAFVNANLPDWNLLLNRLEIKLNSFSDEGELGKIRKNVSSRCAEFGCKNKGIYTCSAFTGAGKTLASLRFALEQAKKFNMDRIFIIAPYTSIIDQNADCIRNILETENDKGQIVIECHSNLSEEKKSDLYDSSIEYEDSLATWNAPVIVTTMVQFQA